MSKWKLKELFAKVVCVPAQSMVAIALCLAGSLSALVLSAFLPGLWSLAGLTTLLLVAGSRLFGNWPRHEFPMYSPGLGFRVGGQPFHTSEVNAHLLRAETGGQLVRSASGFNRAASGISAGELIR
jgi:hypothetical protein